MIVSNTGFFYQHFTPKTCAHYYCVPIVFKVFQVMVSQAILGIRTYNIAHRNVWIGRNLSFAYIVIVVFQCFGNLYNRTPVMANGNCTAGSANPDFPIAAWTFYFAAMLFDCLAISISTVYLIKMKTAARAASATSKILDILLYDGLGYWVALTAVNIMNIVIYREASHDIQTSGSTLGYAITWIMSQRILIHAREERVRQGSTVVSKPSTRTQSRPPSEFTEKRAMKTGVMVV
ncbi:hypothetical protein BJV74DRAFT_293510 [Russula compacta]|nr:hypothetical protein BJV74DRAFT_293510 [Russula compacta]